MRWEIVELPLKLKFDWVLSRGRYPEKTNFLVCLDQHSWGEIAFNSHFGQEKKDVRHQLECFIQAFEKNNDYQKSLNEVTLYPSVQMGLEMAFRKPCDYSCQSYPTSFSLPVMPESEVESFLDRYDLHRFQSLKIKISSDGPWRVVNRVQEHFRGLLRIDANEAFNSAEEFDVFLKKMNDKERIQFIEQPFPDSKLEAIGYLKEESPIPLMADESLTNQLPDERIEKYFHGINIKLMKAGRWDVAKSQLTRARERGLKVMIGCMIETSLGVGRAMELAKEVDYIDLDGFLLLDNDPFGLVHEKNGQIVQSGTHQSKAIKNYLGHKDRED